MKVYSSVLYIASASIGIWFGYTLQRLSARSAMTNTQFLQDYLPGVEGFPYLNNGTICPYNVAGAFIHITVWFSSTTY